MSFGEEMRAIDPDRITNLMQSLFGEQSVEGLSPEEVELGLLTNIVKADEIPALKALKQGIDTQWDVLRESGMSVDAVQGVKTGVNLVRIVFAAYIDEEEHGSPGVS